MAMIDLLRQRISSLCSAYANGNLAFIQNFIDDDIDFISYAPIEFFPCLGKQQGKAAVVESLKTVHAHFEILTYQPILLVVQDEEAAVTIMARMKQKATGRIIRIVFAQFLRFRSDKIVELREFMDSYDLVEQVFGQRIGVIDG
jgi:ketosteroid isomerase-like protein